MGNKREPQPWVVRTLQVQRAIELRNIVTSLGPAFIKLGQVSGMGAHPLSSALALCTSPLDASCA